MSTKRCPDCRQPISRDMKKCENPGCLPRQRRIMTEEQAAKVTGALKEALPDFCEECQAPQYVTGDGTHHCGEVVPDGPTL